MINERDNVAPAPNLAVMSIKSDVFSERHDTMLVAAMIIVSFLVSAATAYGLVVAAIWLLS